MREKASMNSAIGVVFLTRLLNKRANKKKPIVAAIKKPAVQVSKVGGNCIYKYKTQADLKQRIDVLTYKIRLFCTSVNVKYPLGPQSFQ
jgi:hypothetical protein